MWYLYVLARWNPSQMNRRQLRKWFHDSHSKIVWIPTPGASGTRSIPGDDGKGLPQGWQGGCEDGRMTQKLGARGAEISLTKCQNATGATLGEDIHHGHSQVLRRKRKRLWQCERRASRRTRDHRVLKSGACPTIRCRLPSVTSFEKSRIHNPSIDDGWLHYGSTDTGGSTIKGVGGKHM